MIYFVRHGQTDDNVNGSRLTGWAQTPLNANGLAQAKETAKKLAKEHFDICFCSPLQRTKQTLAEILKYHKDLKVVFDDRLKERNYGDATEKPASVCTFRRWNANDEVQFNIETIEHMKERVSSFYDDLKKDYAGKNVLVVAHSGVGRISYFYFTSWPKNGDYSTFKIDNAEVMKFEL